MVTGKDSQLIETASLTRSRLSAARVLRRRVALSGPVDAREPASEGLRALSPPSAAHGPVTPVMLGSAERIIRFRGMPQAAGAARGALREWERHFEPTLYYDLSLCVSELVTMSVQQRDPRESAAGDHEAELVVRRSDTLVRAELREPGADLVVRNPSVMNETAWGMFIVDRLADRWAVQRDADVVVWCEIDLAPDGRSRRSERVSAHTLAAAACAH